MTEREIFLAVLDLPNQADRSLYLNKVCGDPAQRARVESLLKSHDAAGSFLCSPAVNPPEFNNGETQELGGAATPKDANEADEDLKFLDKPGRSDSLGRLGHYEVLQVLGRGGFGIVFRAFDDILQRVVAVKVMAPQIATLSPARKRFVREAQSSAKVRHENVVQIYEVGEQPLPYLTMEFIPGETLQQKLDRSGPLEVTEILRIGRQIAEGLAAAHACDLIHRDIKPGNILLEGGSHKAKITDFGLARAADDASISQSGVIAGTPMFMAPEQALGHKLDHRADLFSLGSVLYQMASGRPPFRAPSALAVLKRVAEESPRPIPEIIPESPDWLCGIIGKLHAKNPDDRFQSAREVADLLADCEAKLKAKQEVKNILPGEPSRVSGRVERPPLSAGRKWVAAAALLMLVAALGITEATGVTNFRGTVIRLFSPEGTLVVEVDDSKVSAAIDGSNKESIFFNGKNTTGWVAKHRMWQVKDGAIVVIPDGPLGMMGPKSKIMYTVKNFRDFELSFQIRLKGGLGRVGVNFRALVPQGSKELLGGRWMFHRGGANLMVVTDDKPTPLESPAKASKPDEFNDVTIRCVGKKVTVTVNGNIDFNEELVDLPDEGVIGWRIGPGVTEATFRNIRLIDLDHQPAPGAVAKMKSNADGWVQLFNGKDLAGWKTLPLHPGDWKVENGLLVGSGPKPGMLFSEQGNFKNFHLRVEAKINDTGNSGIYFRCPFDFLGVYPRLYSAQIVGEAGPNKDFPTGSLYGLKVDKKLRAPSDSWFTMEVIAVGNRITIKVNGVTSVDEFEDNQLPKQGNFALRHSDTETVVEFRKIEIKELPPNPALPPTFKNSIGMEFVIVPKGKSWLGGGKDKLGDKEVEIPADFYLGKYEVMQEEWEKVMGENPSHFSRTGGGMNAVKDISDADLKRFPVDSVSWDDCQIFVAKLNKLEKETGWVYRLPKVVEWEYACRGGPMADKADSAFDFYFAKPTNALFGQANFRTNTGLTRPCKAGSYVPNRLGLFDMHGNVFECCEDSVNFAGGELHRVVSGGCHDYISELCRAASRSSGRPSQRGPARGLRVARVPCGAPSPEAKAPPDSKPTVEVSPAAPTIHDAWLKAVALLPMDQQGAALAAKLKEKLPGFEDAMLKSIPAMPADTQVVLVEAWLRERNPGHEGGVQRSTHDGVVTELSFNAKNVKDISPLRALVGLKVLSCLEGSLSVLSPLKGMSLTALNLRGTQVQDLSPLKGMPLTLLNLDACPEVGELSPLKDMPLTSLSLNATQVRDLAPLKGVPLASLSLAGCIQIKDLAPLNGMQLTLLNLDGCAEVRDLLPLKDMPLTSLSLNATQVRDLAPLKDVPLASLSLAGCIQIKDLGPLKGMQLTLLNLDGCPEVRDLDPLKDMPLISLSVNATQVRDLAPLKGMPLTSLSLTQCIQIKELTPLKGMPLTLLNLDGCTEIEDLTPLKAMQLTSLSLAGCIQIKDFAPLKGMPLTSLNLHGILIRDLEPLKGLPLKLLNINDTGVADLRPLLGLRLEEIRLNPKNVTQGLDILREMKSLKSIGIGGGQLMPAAEFWARYDKGEFAK